MCDTGARAKVPSTLAASGCLVARVGLALLFLSVSRTLERVGVGSALRTLLRGAALVGFDLHLCRGIATIGHGVPFSNAGGIGEPPQHPCRYTRMPRATLEMTMTSSAGASVKTAASGHDALQL